MATLGDILQLLPDVGRERLAYNPSYWVMQANQVLGVIETKVNGPEFYMEAYIPLASRQTLYKIPDGMRVIQRLRWPDEVGIMQIGDKSSAIPFDVMPGKFIRLRTPLDFAATVVNLTQTISSKTAIRRDPGQPITQAVVEGWGCIVTHTTTTGAVEYRRVLKLDTDNPSQVNLDGELEAFAVSGDTAKVFDLYLVIEGRKKLTRFVDDTSISPLAEEWDRIIAHGLRFILEAQSEEDGASQASQSWEARFLDALADLQGEASERPGDQGFIQPRGGAHFSILG